jgi:hypothetical protein
MNINIIFFKTFHYALRTEKSTRLRECSILFLVVIKNKTRHPTFKEERKKLCKKMKLYTHRIFMLMNVMVI